MSAKKITSSLFLIAAFLLAACGGSAPSAPEAPVVERAAGAERLEAFLQPLAEDLGEGLAEGLEPRPQVEVSFLLAGQPLHGQLLVGALVQAGEGGLVGGGDHGVGPAVMKSRWTAEMAFGSSRRGSMVRPSIFWMPFGTLTPARSQNVL